MIYFDIMKGYDLYEDVTIQVYEKFYQSWSGSRNKDDVANIYRNSLPKDKYPTGNAMI
jgi:hypothetical protein